MLIWWLLCISRYPWYTSFTYIYIRIDPTSYIYYIATSLTLVIIGSKLSYIFHREPWCRYLKDLNSSAFVVVHHKVAWVRARVGEIDPCDAGDKRCGNGGTPPTLTLPRNITPPTKRVVPQTKSSMGQHKRSLLLNIIFWFTKIKDSLHLQVLIPVPLKKRSAHKN